jgi:CheY-like chemotaxis protein
VLVALSGWGQSVDRQRSAQAGFAHHLVKPADPAAVLQLIESASMGR